MQRFKSKKQSEKDKSKKMSERDKKKKYLCEISRSQENITWYMHEKHDT